MPNDASSDRLILAAYLSSAQQSAVAEHVSGLVWPAGAELKRPERYHVTVLFSPIGGRDPAARAWLAAQSAGRSFPALTGDVDMFTNPGQYRAAPVVLRLRTPELDAFAHDLLDAAPAHGLAPSRFDAVFNAHIRLGSATAVPDGALSPLALTLGPLAPWD